MQKNVYVKKLFTLSFALTIALIGTIVFPPDVFADNCFITAHPTSDPAPSVFTYNGVTKVYFYCTQDKIGVSGSYPIDTIHCYSSTDMFHWKDEGTALDEKSVPWARQGFHQLWAPHVVFLKGRYCMYVPETASDGKFYNFLATSNNPVGPFTPAPTYITGLGSGVIDPFCFIEPSDSSVWLSYRDGNNSDISYMRMNDSGTASVGTKTIVNTGAGVGYKEGSWMWKLNSIYYLVFAFQPNNSGDEIIAYSTASSAQGPWTYHGEINARNANEFTNHSGSCFFNNRWYFFCHNITFGGSLFGSERCSDIEYMTINGTTIPEIPKTNRGVGVPSAYGDSLQVDRGVITGATSVAIPYNAGGTEKTGWYIGSITTNASVQYDSVDFTPTAGNKIGTVIARVSSGSATSTIEVHIGSASGTLLGTISVPRTGGLTAWTTTTASTLAATPPAGHQNLVLVFKCAASNTFQINWVQFGQVPATSIKIGGVYIGQFGFEFQRIDKHTFTIDCANEASQARIHMFNVTGREIAHAASKISSVNNRVIIDLDARHFAPGPYILSIKNHNRTAQTSFIFE